MKTTGGIEKFEGLFFDGVSSKAIRRTLFREDNGDLILDPNSEGASRISPLEYKTIRPVGDSPIVLRFENGAEIHVATDSRSKKAFGFGVSRLTQLIETIETRPLSALCVVLLAIGVSFSLYTYGLPLIAKKMAPHIPIAMKREIGSQGLGLLDKILFMPTSLSDEQQARPKKLVQGLQTAIALPLEPNVMTRLMGRGDKEVTNALALLPNTIIATDKLVKALDDSELEAVLAHEMGHLFYDHGTQSLVRGSAISIATLLLFGGDPGVFQALAINLIDSKNSRDHEREADRFALDSLAKKGSDPMALHKALRKISEGREESGLSSYLSSHPMTSTRLHEIERYSRRQQAPGGGASPTPP